MYNERKTAKLRRWTRIVDACTTVMMIIAAVYIQFTFSSVLAAWFRMLLGIVVLLVSMVSFRAEIKKILLRLKAILAVT